jgi:peroxiredoxin
MAITSGQKAPAFTLVDQDKNMVSLESFKGKNVLLLFFPAAFTGVCTKEMCSTTDELAFYNKMNAQVFGISVDLPFSLGKFKELNKIEFPLLSDFNKEAITAYGVNEESWILGLKGVSKRAVFVVDKEGNVAYSEVMATAGEMPDFDKVKEALSKLN